MSPRASDFLTTQLAAYDEAWKHAHIEAMEVWDLQAFVRVSLGLYDAVRAIDVAWSEQVRAKLIPFDPADAHPLRDLYARAMGPSALVLDRVGHFERLGYDVDDADRYRDAARRVAAAQSVTADGLAAGAGQAARGEGRPADAVRRELRRRLHT